ncbi:MAG: hypothetical protein NVSMB6_15430 [Burkholderiaceae bacterium]
MRDRVFPSLSTGHRLAADAEANQGRLMETPAKTCAPPSPVFSRNALTVAFVSEVAALTVPTRSRWHIP